MKYSGTLKNLPKPEEIPIKNLADYINLFSSREFNEYIIRGEPANYHSTVSSALRKRDREFPFIQMKNEFKREIFHRLTPDERTNFLAFAQHHGIPTNLIDFTRAPLVALYFACQPFEISDDPAMQNKGFVYLLKDEMVEITHLLTDAEDENFLNLFITNTNDMFFELYLCFEKYEKKHPQNFYRYFKILNNEYNFYFGENPEVASVCQDFPECENLGYKDIISYEHIHKNKEIVRELKQRYGRFEEAVLEYTLKLQNFLNCIIKYGETVFQLNCIPNFIYNPILSFERGRSQKGLFIYQAFLSFDDDLFDMHVLSQQRVWADIVLLIENKSAILKELDIIGINEKYIYGDYDSIARYIKRKYEQY